MIDLFSYAETYPNAPGHRGIKTSIEGAKAIKPHVNSLHARILRELDFMGTHGATNSELRKHIHIESGCMSARLRELCLQGKIKDSGMTRKNDDTGVSQVVWVLT